MGRKSKQNINLLLQILKKHTYINSNKEWRFLIIVFMLAHENISRRVMLSPILRAGKSKVEQFLACSGSLPGWIRAISFIKSKQKQNSLL
jgi:hypothetical protein